VISDIGQLDSAMEHNEEERKLPISTAMLSSPFQISFPYFLSLSLLAIGKEEGERWDIVWEDVGCA
jgi:hypothetical protein